MMRDIIFFLFILFLGACNPGRAGGPAETKEAKEDITAATELSSINTLPDTATVNHLIRKGYSLFIKAPEKAIPVFMEALRICKQFDYPEGRAIIYNDLACCYYETGDHEKKNYYLKLADAQLSGIPSPYFNAKSHAHQRFLISKFKNSADKYYTSGNYDSAAVLYTRVIKQIGQPDTLNYSSLALTYIGLGAIASRVSDFQGALSYFNKAETIAARYADSNLKLSIQTNKASLYLDQGQLALARKLALEGFNLSKKANNYDMEAYNANTIAVSFLREEQPEKARPYSRLVLENGLKIASDDHIINGYYILGYNHVRLGQYEKAKELLLKGLQQAQYLGKSDNIANVYGQLSVAYQGLGQYYKALQYRIKYSDIRDSLLGKETAGRIAEVEAKYRLAQKDKELAKKDKALLQKQLKIASQQKHQYLWIGGSAVCILILLILLYHKRYQNKLIHLRATINGEEKERTRLARELHDGVVSRLSIIKMHFSALPLQYKNLNDTTDFREIVDQLEQSITELRTTSHNLLPEILERVGLAESLKIYCEKIRKIALLDIEFQIIGELPPLNNDFQLNIYRILQELVNNIIKHSNASHALLQFQVNKTWLNITLDDNGNGTLNHTGLKDQTNGIGMQNLQNRVQLLNGTLEIESGKGTSVYLEFNLKKFVSDTEPDTVSRKK